jgi:uncharacterized protein YqgC (DUF456 family)
MAWVYYVLLLVVMIIGIAATLFGLPGIWLIVGGVAIYAMLTGFGVYVGWWTLAVLLVLGIAAEVAEFLAGTAGAKQAGGSRRAGLGAIVGALLGGLFLTPVIPIPIVGTVIGLCLGAFIGAGAMEMTARQDVAHSFRVGTGAAKGRFYGIIVKLCFAVVMLFVGLWMAFPVRGHVAIGTATATPVTSPPPNASTQPVITTAPG